MLNASLAVRLVVSVALLAGVSLPFPHYLLPELRPDGA